MRRPMKKRLLSILLAAAMVLSLLSAPAPVWAAEPETPADPASAEAKVSAADAVEETTETVDNTDTETTAPAETAVTASGTCGENLTWVLTDDGTLTISGTGAMEDYTGFDAPWYDYHSAISSVVIGSGVTTVGAYAFSEFELANTITAVTLPDTLVSIGRSAFSHCYKLASVTVPGSVSTIGALAFMDCIGLESVHLADLSAWCAISFGDPYANPLYYGDLYLNGELVTDLVIPEEITTISDYAFNGSSITSLSLPEGMTEIGNGVFKWCEQLETVTLPSTLETVGEAAFMYTEISAITIPASVTEIRDIAFSCCFSLTQVKFLGDAPEISLDAFEGVAATVYYPAGNDTWTEEVMQQYGGTLTWESYVSAIASGTCGDNLTWTLTEDGTLTISGTGPMYHYATIEDSPWTGNTLYIKQVIIEEGVTSVGSYAFISCYTLETVSLPESVRAIGNNAFSSCTSLHAVNIPEGLTYFGSSSFACAGILYIEIPSGAVLDACAFMSCSSLKEIKFLGDAPAVGVYAFEFAKATCYYPEGNETWNEDTLSNYTHFFTWVPYAVSTNAVVASGTCGEGLTWSLTEGGTLTVSGTGSMADYAAAGDSPWNQHSASIQKVVVQEGVTSVGAYAFRGCSDLEIVRLPESVTVIGDEAFGDCTALHTVNIPEGVTEIGAYAFASTAISFIQIPSAAVLGEYAFTGCSNLKEIRFLADAPTFEALAFSGVEATAYYPEGNETWTEDALRPYGGTLTWRACIASGICGKDLRWYITDDDTLNVSGTGRMYDYVNGYDTPWYAYHSSYTNVVIGNGVTALGSSVFGEEEDTVTGITSITLPDTLEYIGSGAFLNCAQLRSISIPSSVSAISNSAFNGCTGLESVYIEDLKVWCSTYFGDHSSSPLLYGDLYLNGELVTDLVIPDNVKYITGYAFRGSSIKSLALPEGMTQISSYTFSNCSQLEEVSLPSTLKTIGYEAFGRSAMTSIVIPDGVTSIMGYAFYSCANLTAVTLPASAAYEEGVFTGCENIASVTLTAGTGIMPDFTETYESTPWYGATNVTVTIADGVTEIGAYAFYDSAGLAAVKFLGDAPVIDETAFTDVTTMVYYPAGNDTWTEEVMQQYGGDLTWEYYGDVIRSDSCGDGLLWVFEDTGILRISGTGAMDDYTSEAPAPWRDYADSIVRVSIGEGVSYIGSEAFSACSNVERIDLPGTLTEIADYAFMNCSSIQHIVLPDSLVSIGEGAFSGCKNLEIVTISENLSALSSYLFKDCGSLEFIVIPSNIGSIGVMTFGGCSKLSRVIFSGAAPAIDTTAFTGITATAYYLSDNDTWTGETMQQYDGNLTWTPVIAAGRCGDAIIWTLTEDGTLAISGTGAMYDYATSITDRRTPWRDFVDTIINVSVGPDVTYIGDSAFARCTNLTKILIPDGVTSIGSYAFQYCSSLVEVVLPEGLTAIEEAMFRYCDSLTDITIPDGVISIGDEAFFSCTSLTEIIIPDGVTRIENATFGYCSLSDITIPDGVTSIGQSAFFSCTNLTSISLPDSIISIENYAFQNCRSLNNIAIPDGVTSIGSQTFDGCSSLEDVDLPENLTYIGGEAFAKCSSLTSITLPESVISMGFSVFQYCTGLVDVTLPQNLTSIANSTFEGCSSLTSITIPGNVTSIGERAFHQCSNLTSVTISNGVTSIEKYAFNDCSSLSNITLSDSLVSIGYSAFGGCSSLTSIVLPESLTTIDSYIFYECDSLTGIILPQGVTAISSYAFAYSGLTDLVIPQNITKIGHRAFANCDNLSSVTFQGDAPSFGSYAFSEDVATVYYPVGNDTWTEEVMQQYGGTLTWVPVSRAELAGATLTTEGNIGVNFFMELSADLPADSSAQVLFSMGNASKVVPVSEAVVVDGMYRFTYEIAAKHMADDIVAQVYNSYGTVGEPMTYSVMDYYEAVKANFDPEADAALYALMEAMLNYGAYSQLHFGYQTGALANAGLEDSLKALPQTVDASAYRCTVVGGQDGIVFSGASLLLQSQTSIRLFFTLTGDKRIEEFTFTVAGETVTPAEKNGMYYVELSNIAAKDLDEMYSVSVGGLTVSYSALSYVCSVLSKPDSFDADLVDLVKALYIYSEKANAYFE